jgi:hypothetical protein
MKKLRFNQLPIYKAIRGSKLSKRAQDEVLRKLEKRVPLDVLKGFRSLFGFHWMPVFTNVEGEAYWLQMHKDSQL